MRPNLVHGSPPLMRSADVTVVTPYLLGTSNVILSRPDCPPHLPKEWVRLALSDATFFQFIPFAACRHLSEYNVPKRQLFIRSSHGVQGCLRTGADEVDIHGRLTTTYRHYDIDGNHAHLG